MCFPRTANTPLHIKRNLHVTSGGSLVLQFTTYLYQTEFPELAKAFSMERHKCFKLFSQFRSENPAPVNQDPVGESQSTRPGVLTRDPPKLVKDPVLESQSERCGASTRDPHKSIDDRALESHFSSLFDNYQARILMEQPPQRVAITSSMLYAYAAIRGNSDKEHLRLSDPLHSSLYLTPCSYVNPQFEQPIDLRWWQNHNDPGLLTEWVHFNSIGS
jgi:hypothetical protein